MLEQIVVEIAVRIRQIAVELADDDLLLVGEFILVEFRKPDRVLRSTLSSARHTGWSS